jgi:CcmD family protein
VQNAARWKRFVRLGLATFVIGLGLQLLSGTRVEAAPGHERMAATDAPQDPQEMIQMSELERETLPAAPFVYGAYAFVWVALLVYVFVLWRRLGRVERELADINAKLRARKS